MRGRIIALILALTFVINFPSGFAAEPRSYQPPANTPVIPWKRFSIAYAVRIVGNALTSKVEFYITNDGGQTWKKYGEDPDKISPMVITVPQEGTYGFITAISTNVRPAIPPRPGTKPDKFVIVDRTPPQARWVTPNAEQVLLTETGIELSWVASDKYLGLTPVDIEYSTDGGNFWLPLREKLPAKGSINWNPPIIEGQTDIALRLIATDLAGNKRIVRNKTSFTLDNTPPVVTILGPSSSGSFKFDVEYTATDNESGVKNIELFYTVDGGTEWFYYGADSDLRSPINFSAPAAKEVGLYIVATDKNGNKNPAPARGAMPMAYVTLDMDAPQVTILPPFTTSGEVIAKDEVVNIRWNSSDANIKEGSTQIQLSRDGGATWTDLAFDKASNGSWQWVPTIAGNNLLLKINVSDMMGNIGTAISMPFSVDEKRPTMQFESITPIDNGAPMTDVSQTTDISVTEQGDDLWAPSVPSVVDLESETITDLPDGKTQTEKIDISETDSPDFSPIDESLDVNQTSEPTVEDITTTDTELNIPAPVEDSSVPSLNEDFAKNEISEDEFAPIADTESSNIPEEAVESSDSMVDDDLGDLGLDSIPEVPAINDSTTNETEPNIKTETGDLSLDEEEITTTTIPEPGSLNIGESTAGEDDMTIPSIPDIGDTSNESIEDISITSPDKSVSEEATTAVEDIPNVPDLPASTDTEGNEADFGLPPVIEEQTTETLDLPLDLDSEIPQESSVSADELVKNAQIALEKDVDLDKAESLAKEAIGVDPNNAQAYAIVSSVLTEKGSYDSAFDYAHKAINLAPDNAEYLQILGYAQYQKAVEINKMLSASNLTPTQVSNLGSQLRTALDQADEAYSKMLSSTNETDVKEGYYRLAQVNYFKATRIFTDEIQVSDALRKAIANYQKAYSIGEPDYREVLQIGICNYRLGDYDQSEQWLEKAQEVAPVDRAPKEAFFYLALINEKTNRPAEALPFWQKVAEFYPDGSSYKKLAETRITALSGM